MIEHISLQIFRHNQLCAEHIPSEANHPLADIFPVPENLFLFLTHETSELMADGQEQDTQGPKNNIPVS